MSREKLPMSTVSVDQLFILMNKQQVIDDAKQNQKQSFKAIANQMKEISIKERNQMLSKKTYNNIKAFKHSNRLLHKTMKNVKLQNSVINPQNSIFQNEDQAFNTLNTLPQNYKAFPKRESPLKNNNPCKFFLATQPKKLHQRLQQNSIMQMDSKIYILVNSSFSNSRIKDETRRIRHLYSQRRKTSTIRSDQSPRCFTYQETISLMKLPKENLTNKSPRTLKRPKTSSFRANNEYCKKDNIQPWQNFAQHENSDNQQIANKK